MAEAPELKTYREFMLTMINLINQEIGLQEKNQVLIVLKLNTDEKIRKWMEWLRPRVTAEGLQATEVEIVRAAVQIGKGIL